MISNRCARKSLLINCNSIISKNYLRFLVDNNDFLQRRKTGRADKSESKSGGLSISFVTLETFFNMV